MLLAIPDNQWILELPDELLLAILSHASLSIIDSHHLMFISKRLNTISLDSLIWERHYRKLIKNTDHKTKGRSPLGEIKRFFSRMARQGELHGDSGVDFKAQRMIIPRLLPYCYADKVQKLSEEDLAWLGIYIRGCIFNHKIGFLPYVSSNSFSRNQLETLFTLTSRERRCLFNYDFLTEVLRGTSKMLSYRCDLAAYEDRIFAFRQSHFSKVWPVEAGASELLNADHSLSLLAPFVSVEVLSKYLDDNAAKLSVRAFVPVLFYPISSYSNQLNTELILDWLKENRVGYMFVLSEVSHIISDSAIPAILEAFHPYIPKNLLPGHLAKQLDSAMAYNYQLAIQLLQKGIKCPENHDAQMHYLFMQAAYDGELSVMQWLYPESVQDLNVCSNAPNWFGEVRLPIAGLTPLMAAVIGKRAHIVKWLLEQGANPTISVYHQDIEVNALWFALCYEDILTFTTLLAYLKPSANTSEVRFDNLPHKQSNQKRTFMLQTLERFNSGNDSFSFHAESFKGLDLGLPAIENTTIVVEKASNPYIKKVRESIDALKAYSDRANNNKREKAAALVQLLEDEVSFFEQTLDDSPLNKTSALGVFKKHMRDHLNNHKLNKDLYLHQDELQIILLNICIAVTGLGLLCIAGKIAYTALTEPSQKNPSYTHLLFFGKTATQSRMDAIEQTVIRYAP